MPAMMSKQKSTAPRLTGERRRCRLATCGKEFPVTIQARDKQFCCASHRYEWHGAERARAIAALREAEAGGKTND